MTVNSGKVEFISLLQQSTNPLAGYGLLYAVERAKFSHKLLDLLPPLELAQRIDEALHAAPQHAPEQARSYCNALKLTKELGITHPYRMEPQDLIQITAVRTSTNVSAGRDAFILVARSDHNGALVSLSQPIRELLKHGYRVWYYEVSDIEKEIAEQPKETSISGAVADYRQRTGSSTAALIMLYAHGSSSGIELYSSGVTRNSLNTSNISRVKELGFFELADPRVTRLVVNACGVAGETFLSISDNFIEKLRAEAGKKLSAGMICGPQYSTSNMELYFDPDSGELANVSFNGGTVTK
jgi:hypothetical protein